MTNPPVASGSGGFWQGWREKRAREVQTPAIMPAILAQQATQYRHCGVDSPCPVADAIFLLGG
jgi:hypothetical protein